MDELEDPEASYRRGYYQGAWDVIQAVSSFLSEDLQSKLKGWHAKRVFGWRYHNKYQRGPNNMIPGSIVPPRQYLNLRRR